MTHEETIKRIQELVPSVMELEFGCEVKLKHTSRKVRNAKVLVHTGDGRFQIQERIDTSINEEEYKKDYGRCEIAYYEKDSFEILGKPITLAVVIMAINQKYIESNNVWFVYDLRQTQLSGIEKWNLSKDNFNDQTEETKTFIGGLLGIKYT